MLGDFFTKPLQGTLFNKFRNHILNIQVDPLLAPLQDHRSALGQERSRAIEQSQGQSLATAPSDQNKCPKPSNETIRNWDEQPQEQPSVQAVMAPISQPVGGWHVTSMTRHLDDQNVPRPGPLLVEAT